jgi:membrane-associated phospholipid phosphatase
MKSLNKAAALLATAIVPMLLATPVAASQHLTEDQKIGYLGATSKSTLARGVFDRLKNQRHVRRSSDTTDRIVMWHEVLLDSIAIDHTPDPDTGFLSFTQGGPGRTSRALAMTQVAVFDAVNAFDGKFASYNKIGEAPELASQDAAIAWAAHDMLVALFPDQTARLEGLLASDLANIQGGTVRITLGRSVGKRAAAAMLARRSNDNSNNAEADFGQGGRVATGLKNYYNQPVNGGSRAAFNWEPDPLTPDAHGIIAQLTIGASWGGVSPFILQTGNQFRIGPPPAPGSATYTNGFNEVKAIGASPDTIGSTSTETTRFIGNFWGYDAAPLLGTPPRLYNQIAVGIAKQQGIRKPAEMARFLAIINAGIGDGGVAAWDSKWFYNYWRPVTGVRRGDEDGSAATAGNPAWKPVGASVINTTTPVVATPPFPAYPSGHATFGATTVTLLKSYFPDRTAFTFVSDEYNGQGTDPFGTPRPMVPVRFRTLSEIQELNGISRVYNGVHWQWDNLAGQSLGVNIGNYVAGRAFRRVRDD